MKKTFKLNIEGKNRDRVLDAVKHEIRKYVKRERRRALPEGVDFWDFDCRFGATEEQAIVVHFATLTELIDGIATAGGGFVELSGLGKVLGDAMATLIEGGEVNGGDDVARL